MNENLKLISIDALKEEFKRCLFVELSTKFNKGRRHYKKLKEDVLNELKNRNYDTYGLEDDYKKEYKESQNENIFPDDETNPTAESNIYRIMYIENKSTGLTGEAKIGKVTFSKTGKTLYYNGLKFKSLKGSGFKSNYYEVSSGDEYWISGPKKNGQDRLYGERLPIEIDENIREEYWTTIRKQPSRVNDIEA